MAEFTEVGYAMGTFLETRFEKDPVSADKEIRGIFRKVEEAASFFLPGSDVSRINEKAGEEPVEAGPLLTALLRKALEAARFTEGFFDPAIGSLTGLWRIGQENEHIPSQREEEEAQRLVNYRKVRMRGNQVFLEEKGMALDLGGIAKEEALWASALLAESYGLAGMIDAGGDMALTGRKEDGSAWRIGIQHPRRRGQLAAVFSLDEENMVETSGDYRRFLLQDGRFQSHIFGALDQRDPLVSATLVYRRGRAHPPLYGSACIAGGLDHVASWLERLAGMEGVFITAGMKVYVTEGLAFRVKVLAEGAQKKALILHR